MTDYAELVRRLRDADTCDERGSFTPDPVAQAAADAIERLADEAAELERYRSGDIAEAIRDMHRSVERQRDEALAEVERLTQERDEAREKAKALDELEAWLGNHGRSQWTFDACLTRTKVTIDFCIPNVRVVGEGSDVVPAIRAALEKARGE